MSGRTLHESLLSLLLLATGTAAIPAAENQGWTSFQNGGRLAQSAPELPLEWSPSAGIAWKTAIDGSGQSSPVVWDGHVYVTSCSGAEKQQCHVSAFQLTDGQKIWQKDFTNPSPQENSGYVSVAAPTPAADESGVIAFFEGGMLIALSHDGEIRWERNLVAEYGPIASRHGVSASVEQDASRAFIWVERETDPYVLAIDKATGANIWKVAGIGATSWASPRLLAVPGGEHLVLSAIGSITGLDPATGEKMWTMTGIAGNSTPTPVPVSEGRFLIGATTGRGEGAAAGGSSGSNGLVEVRKADGTWTADYVWRAKRATSSFGSPVAAGNKAWFVNRTGVLYGLDLETGEEKFAERIGDSIWATPLVIDDRVLFFGKNGVTTIVTSTGDFTRLGENKAWESEPMPQEQAGPPGAGSGTVLYGIALSGNRLVLRSGSELICVGR